MFGATPAAQNIRALQQRMVQLGFATSADGVYGGAERAVLESYAAQLGIDDLRDLDSVIVQVLPAMDADIEVKGLWKPPGVGGVGADTTQISGSAGSAAGLGLALLFGVGLWWLATSK